LFCTGHKKLSRLLNLKAQKYCILNFITDISNYDYIMYYTRAWIFSTGYDKHMTSGTLIRLSLKCPYDRKKSSDNFQLKNRPHQDLLYPHWCMNMALGPSWLPPSPPRHGHKQGSSEGEQESNWINRRWRQLVCWNKIQLFI
jgi:hypothetical protein